MKTYRKSTSSTTTTPQVSPAQSPKHQRAQPTMASKEKEKEKESQQPMLQTIQETLVNMQDFMQKTKEESKQQYEESRKQLDDFRDEIKAEIKTEMGEMKEKMKEMGDQMKDIQQAIKENEQKTKTIEEQLGQIDVRQKIFEEHAMKVHKTHDVEITTMEMHRAAHGLRFQNIIEEKDENLPDKMAEIIGGILQEDPQEILKDIDEVYRVHTSYARNHNLPREVHIIFTRRIIRENILRYASNTDLKHQGKPIHILKQVPRKVRENRREFHFLTKVLIKEKITFRWLIPGGLSLMWEGKRIRLETPEDARDFYETSGLSKLDPINKGASYQIKIYEKPKQTEEQMRAAQAEEIQSGARKKQPQEQEQMTYAMKLREPREVVKYSK